MYTRPDTLLSDCIRPYARMSFILELDLPVLPRSTLPRSGSSPPGNFTVYPFWQTFVFITSSVTARDFAAQRSATSPAYRGPMP